MEARRLLSVTVTTTAATAVTATGATLNGTVNPFHIRTLLFAMAALTPAGTLDPTFGSSGIDQAGYGDSLAPGTAPLAVNADGKIFVGTATNGGSSVMVTVTEYNANGSIDTSFGTSGTASVTVPGVSIGPILNILSDGQIVVGAGGVGSNFILARFNADGSVDTTFGSSGIETGAAISSGLAMVIASSGEAVLIGRPASGYGLILQEFHTLANRQVLYVEQDADYNVTSLTNSSGGVIERYSYDGYGNVTVLNANGSVRGDGTAASSFYGCLYLHQGLRLDGATGLYYDQIRQTYDPALGRFLQEDPAGYVDGSNIYQLELSSPPNSLDPSGFDSWGWNALKTATNALNGAMDQLTWGATDKLRAVAGLNGGGGGVDSNSTVYQVGEGAEAAVEIVVTGGASELGKQGLEAVVKEAEKITEEQTAKLTEKEFEEAAAKAAENGPLKGQAAKDAAKDLGYPNRIPPQKVPFNSHGQPAFTDGKNYITPDVDSHSGGAWKLFDRNGNRIGTLDGNGNKIGP